MRVIRYEAHNILRLSDINLDLEGHNLYLVGGKNGMGKTSALNALLVALCGKSGMDYPEELLKTGETKGWVKVELSGDEDIHEPTGLKVELHLRRKRNGKIEEEFRILDSAGEEAPEPRTLLKRLYNTRGFDPLAFERLDRKGKRATLQGLLGLDFTAEKQKHKSLYDLRSDYNREAKRLLGKLEALPPKVAGVPDTPVSVSVLVSELEIRRAKNQNVAKIRAEVPAAEKLLAANQAESAKIAEQILVLQRQVDGLYKQEDELTKQLDAAKEAASQCVEADENEIRVQIKDAERVNALVAQKIERAKVDTELAAAESESESCTEKMQEITDAIDAALKAAKWPVDGLSLDDEGVLFNGLPFEQASKSQRVLVSTKIGMALNPKLRLLVCQDGNDLDQDSMAALEKMLAENDFQMLVEIVTRTPADEDLCAVVIRDGAQVDSESGGEVGDGLAGDPVGEVAEELVSQEE